MGSENLNFLPVSINVTGKKILIVGGGNVALHKATILSRFTSEARIVAPQFREGFENFAFRLIRKSYEPTDLDGMFLVYVCTENESLNRQIKADCQGRGILASVCDSPEICDFISPAIYKKNHVTVAVSSNARDVRQSIRIRNRIRELTEAGTISIDRPEMIRHLSVSHAGYSLEERENAIRHMPPEIVGPYVHLRTCNRVEWYWGQGELPEETLRHLCRVASGLESGLIGERAIQGQVKQAYETARKTFDLPGPLHKLFQTALRTGRRVRAETTISTGAVSHSQAVAELIAARFPSPENLLVTVVGINKITEDLLKFLNKKGFSSTFLSNRNLSKAQETARKYGCAAVPLSEKEKFLAYSDIVICATSAPHPIIREKDIPENKPLSIFDLSFPRNVDEAAGLLVNVSLYNLETIESQVRSNIRTRQGEITRAEQIIEEEIRRFNEWKNFSDNLKQSKTYEKKAVRTSL